MTSFKQTMQMEITHTINNSQYKLNKFQVFLENNIAYQYQTLSAEKLRTLLLSPKAQRTQDDGWFYSKQVQEMPPHTLPKTVVYQDQVDKGEALSRHHYKETRILLIDTV